MKKPINKWAVAMWLAAGLDAASWAYTMFDKLPSSLMHLMFFSDFLRLTIFQFGMLVGMGAVIELVDQIRWSETNAQK